MITAFFKILVAMTSLTWSGPLIVRNGAGQAEFYLIYAQKHHGELITLCRSQAACATGVEKELEALTQTKLSSDLELSFLTSAEMGDETFQFLSPKNIRFNKDKLVKNVAGEITPWSLADAVKFFVWIRAGGLNWDSATIEKVSERLADFSGVTLDRSMNQDYRNLSLILVRTSGNTLIVEDTSIDSDAKTLEIPWSQISCAGSNQVQSNIIDPVVVSARWGSSDPRNTEENLLSIIGLLNYKCQDASGKLQSFHSRYRITVDAFRENVNWHIKPETISFIQTEIEKVP